jgi:hypothetical protein
MSSPEIEHVPEEDAIITHVIDVEFTITKVINKNGVVTYVRFIMSSCPYDLMSL